MTVTIVLKEIILAKVYKDIKSVYTKDGFYVMTKEKLTIKIPVSEIKELEERK